MGRQSNFDKAYFENQVRSENPWNKIQASDGDWHPRAKRYHTIDGWYVLVMLAVAAAIIGLFAFCAG